ncbi:uncharacterized protein LOC142230516 isoform X3 [Haematobia irritans]|uniref:uncharacterized protein LOC142230516 isoform X3 n=1 Tax=Haematobia irritans TaxID=7368 RepID=UPI003F502FCC
MAAFVAPEDLEKLKKFIDFVAANPLILNTPQLGFLKRFVEKLGGKVPEGEFQMPAGGKCPFGGDAKSETKPSPPTQPEEGDVPVVEEESEESEVELDMEESNTQLLEPNVLYLDEKPPKIVQITKSSKRGERSKKRKRKTAKSHIPIISRQKKTKSPRTVKKELSLTVSQKAARDFSTFLGEDPLFTPEKEIKMEITYTNDPEDVIPITIDSILTKYEEQDPKDTITMTHNDDKDQQQQPLENEDFSVDDEDDYKMKYEQDEVDDYSLEECSEDDEPLIQLARKKGRPRKYRLKQEDTNKTPGLAICRNICKQKCTQKFTEEQRNAMCEAFWSMSEEDKTLFIRKHTKTKRFKRLKRNKTKSRGSNYCYYLDAHNNIPKDDDDNDYVWSEDGCNLTRVCRKYFESTLCLTNYTIKKALEGYQPVIESGASDQKIDVDGVVGDDKKVTTVLQQYLDPETGNLITIDPREERLKKAIDAPKKKRVRPKPGDPLPEHNPKPIKCAERCIHKCHTKFTEDERKQICDVFWSMDYNRRKDFVLARIETREVETERAPEFRKSNRPPRAYHTRFFLRSGRSGENIRVCKHFLMATLSITRNFITNAIEFADKNTGCYTGADRRGHHSTPRRISPDRMKIIKDQIGSYPTWLPNKKSKTRYLHHSLSIKRMFREYKEMCVAKQMKFVSTHIYYKTFHEDFRLSFLCNPEPKRGGGFLKANPNVSHYTGEEVGGFWLDPFGEKLDLNLHNPAHSFMNTPSCSLTSTNDLNVCHEGGDVETINSTLIEHQLPPSSAITSASTTTTNNNFAQPFSYVHLIDPNMSSNFMCPSLSLTAQNEINVNIYDSNLPQAHGASSTSTSLFKRP